MCVAVYTCMKYILCNAIYKCYISNTHIYTHYNKRTKLLYTYDAVLSSRVITAVNTGVTDTQCL